MKNILLLALLVSLSINLYFYMGAQGKDIKLQYAELLFQARDDGARQLIGVAKENFIGLTSDNLQKYFRESGIGFRVEADPNIKGESYLITSQLTFRFGPNGGFKSVFLNKL